MSPVYSPTMKRSEILFGLLKIPIDLLAVFGAVLIAYRLREASVDFLPTIELLPAGAQLPPLPYYVSHFALPTTALYILLLAGLRLYSLNLTMSAWREVGRILLTSALWLVLIIAWFFLIQKQLFFSRFLLIFATVLTTLFVLGGRIVILFVQRSCLRRGIGVRSVLSCGTKNMPESVRRSIAGDRRYKYLGHVASIHSLKHERSKRQIDLVIHTDPNPGSEETIHLINECRSHHVGYAFLPSVFVDVPHQLSVYRLGFVPVLQFQPTPLDGWGRVAKRVFDVLASAILLVVFSPFLLAIALIVWLTSGWPVLYISERVGQQTRSLIPVLKFRTMQRGAEGMLEHLKTLSHRGDGPLFKVKNDPRVTPFGRLLRRWSLDELPQLLNVLLGHLSLVGPRPHLEKEVSLYADDQRRVFAVKPGITGLAQVSGRSNLKFDDEVRLDMQYVEEWSFLLDLWILWRTGVVVLFGEGAD